MSICFFNIDVNRENDNLAFKYFEKDKTLKEISYRTFYSDVERACFYLKNKTKDVIKPHIAIMARNSYDYLVWFYAILGINGVIVPLNIQKQWNEIEYEVDLSDVCLIIEDGDYKESIKEFSDKYHHMLCDINSYTSEKNTLIWEEPKDDDVSLMVFTSGTTGQSKAVVLTYKNLKGVAGAYTSYYETAKIKSNIKDIVYFFCLPQYHMLAIGMIVSCISNEYVAVLNNEPKYFVRDLSSFDANCSAMVPIQIETIYKLLNNDMGIGKMADIVYGGAPCSSDISNYLIKKGITIRNGYGLTENIVATRNDTNLEEKRWSVGQPIGDCEVKIVDGEIVIRSSTLMKEYYKNPQATSESLKDGWLYTGDIGYLDDENFLFLTGRKKNLIILSGGENVSPEELEKLLIKNEKIEEVVVKEKDGKICAEVYCENNVKEEIKSFILEKNRELALYKQISIIEFRDTPFDRTSSGKIKRI